MDIYRHKVHYYETDRMGITHHSNYIRWMEEARIAFLEQAGCSYDKMEKNGIISPVVAVECRYKAPTTFSDTVDILVSVEEFKGARLSFKYEMRLPDGTLACEGRSEHCFTDKDGRLVRPQKDFPEFYNIITSLIG